MVITESAIASGRLIGLGLKLYPRKMRSMFRKDLHVMQSLSLKKKEQETEKLCRQGEVLLGDL